MADAPFVTIFLGLISICLITLAIILLVIALDLRRTLHRINAILPDAGTTLHEAGRALVQVRRLISRVNVTARDVEGVVHRACETASETLEEFALARQRARSAFTKWVGNGAGAEPRSNGKHRK